MVDTVIKLSRTIKQQVAGSSRCVQNGKKGNRKILKNNIYKDKSGLDSSQHYYALCIYFWGYIVFWGWYRAVGWLFLCQGYGRGRFLPK